jgi:hypothetical protein
MLDDPSQVIFVGKLGKWYQADAGVELVCYSGRTAVPDDMALLTLRDLANRHGITPSRRVWFLGHETCDIVA